MKRLLFILPLLYFIGCQYPCDILTLPSKNSDCFKRKCSINNYECCYLQLKVKDNTTGIFAPINVCSPGEKNMKNEDYRQLIETYGKAYVEGREFSVEGHECISSYIKVGFLLLSLILI